MKRKIKTQLKHDSFKTLLPVTEQQFQDLTNELLTRMNQVTAPNFLAADVMAQILVSVIHALPRTQGVVDKDELFKSCVNRVSCQLTYHIAKQLEAKAKEEQEKKTADGAVETPGTQTTEPATSDSVTVQ